MPYDVEGEKICGPRRAETSDGKTADAVAIDRRKAIDRN